MGLLKKIGASVGGSKRAQMSQNIQFLRIWTRSNAQKLWKLFFFASLWQVNNRTRGQGPFGYIGHKRGAWGGPQNSQKMTKNGFQREKMKKNGPQFINKIHFKAGPLANRVSGSGNFFIASASASASSFEKLAASASASTIQKPTASASASASRF